MTGVIVGILIGLFVGVAGAVVYRNNEKRAWKYAITTITEAKAKVEADAAAEATAAERRLYALSETFKTEREKLIQSTITAIEEVLTKPEAELKAAIEALLAKAKSII